MVRSSDGAVVQRMRNDAWGRVEEDFTIAGGSALPFGFAGGMFDRGTGLVHFGAREHDPGVGRWVEKDPVGFGGGLNLYGYASGRPLDLIDSDGLEPNDGPGTLLVPVDQGDYARNAASAGIAAGLAAGAGAATASGAYTFFGSQFRAFLPAAAAALRGCWTDPKLESSAIRASDLVKELNRLDRAAGTMRNTSSVLTEFFKKNADGGNVVITPGITRDLLLVYRQVALEAPQQAGIQADRLELIERALSNIP